MIQQIIDKLGYASSEPIGLILAMLLGMGSALASTCCTLPALGLVASYSGAQETGSRRDLLRSTLFFMLGTIVSLMIIGAVAGFVGQAAQFTLGRYWKLFAGLIAIFFGLANLKLLPFAFSFGNFNTSKKTISCLGEIFTGFVLGGIVAISSLPCNPGIFIVMGAALLQGEIFKAMLLLGMFAIGFALPLGALILGVSLSKFALSSKGIDSAIRCVSGVILIAVGFYFLLTF
jgi:cytochrome c biogenesis protein CcdA